MSGSGTGTLSTTLDSTYLTVDEAADMVLGRPNSTAWTGATADEKLAALGEATRKLDTLPLRGYKYDYDQELEFPRYIDGVVVGNSDQDAVVPDNVKRACLEEAIAILSGSDRRTLQEQGVQSYSIGGKLQETFVPGFGNQALLSPMAKRLMQRYIGAETR